MNQKVMSMARFRIKLLAQQRGIKNATELQKELNIAYSLAREIWREGDLNMETSTLANIAEKLKVSIRDLFADDRPQEGK